MVEKHLLLSAFAHQASVVAVFVSEAAPAPEEEGAGMRSALEYLQKLDKYYSQIARPRYDTPNYKPRRWLQVIQIYRQRWGNVVHAGYGTKGKQSQI